MRLAVIGAIKTAAVIRNCDLTAGIRFSCPDENVKRAGIGISAMFDSVFHNGLQRQRRDAEPGMRCVVFNEQAVLVLSLLYGKVSAYMLKLGREGNGIRACNCGEILSQIGGKIHDNLTGLLRVLPAEAINARHGVIDKVRPHLENHNAGPLIGKLLLLPGDFPLAVQILIDLIGKDETVHGQGGEDDADIDQRIDFDEHLQCPGDRYRQHGGEKAEKCLAGKLIPAFYHSCEIQQYGCDHRQQQKRV